MTRPRIYFFGLMCLLPSVAYAGAWTQKQDAFQFINTVGFYRTDSYYDRSGNEQSQPDYESYEVRSYVEYGLYDHITLGGQIAYAHAAQSINSNSALLDSELFARFRLWQSDSAVVSVQPYVVIPGFFESSKSPKLGSDDYAFGLRAAYGHNYQLFGKNGYIDIAGAYLYRMGGAADQLKLDLTSELHLDETWSMMPQLFITHSRTDISRASAFTQSADDDYNLTKLQFSVLYRVNDEQRIQLGAFTHLDGKNTGSGNGLLISYWMDF